MTEMREFLIYQSEDGRTKIDVMLDAETLWLNQKQLADLFDKPKSGRIAVKVINHMGDEVMKVFKV